MHSSTEANANYFESLNYSIGDEDSTVEWAMVRRLQPRIIAAIAGSGGRVLPLLACAPARLYVIDTSHAQIALTEMRLAAVRVMARDEYAAFLGYPPVPMSASERRACFEKLSLSAEARQTMQALMERSGWGPPIYLGRFESMLCRLSKILRLVMGRAIDELFDCKNLDEQRAYVAECFPRRRWRAVVAMLGNVTALNSMLYRGAFPKPNTGKSATQSFRDCFDRLFTQIPVRESFFLQLLFLGRVKFAEGIPLEAMPEVYPMIKSASSTVDIRLCRTTIGAAQLEPGDKLDFVSLSDVPSFFAPEHERTFLTRMNSLLSPSAVVVSRGCLRVARPDTHGFVENTSSYADLFQKERTQLWTFRVYGRIPAHSI